MNKIILKIKFLSNKSFEINFIYIDKRLLSIDERKTIYYNCESCDFIIYSSKTLKKSINSLRLPNISNYTKNLIDIFSFENEQKMHMWLKNFHRTLYECSYKFGPFLKCNVDGGMKTDFKLNGDFWIL